ncbi:CPCC family cysteine-rich protein [Halobacteriales archaeon Cl-PHB]
MSSDTPGNPAARELGFCPCCGYLTLSEGTPGSKEVCPVCGWLDDPVQFSDDDCVADANSVSLTEARENFAEVGAVTPDAVEETREPESNESRDPNWPYE